MKRKANSTRTPRRKPAARKRDSFKGVPQERRKVVSVCVAMRRAAGEKVTPQKVYRELNNDRRRREKEAAKLAADEQKIERAHAEHIRERALEALREGLPQLSDLRDAALAIEKGKAEFLSDVTLARFVRLGIEEVGMEIEQALCNLGLVKEDDLGGYFVDRLKSQMPDATEADGRAVAIEMLREMDTYETDDGKAPWPWSIQALCRPVGTQQDNVLLRYMDKIGGNRAALAGFCSVITDELGHARNKDTGSSLHIDLYERLGERDITPPPGEWPRLDDDGNRVTVRAN